MSLAAAMRLLRGPSAAGTTARVAVTNGAILAVNVLTGIITAKYLGAEGRGELAAVLLWPQFLGYLFLFALPPGLLFHSKSRPDDAGRLAGAALALSVVGGCIAATVGVLAMPLLLRHVTPETLAHARWLMPFAIVTTVGATLTTLTQARDRFDLYNRVRWVPQILTLAALLALAAAGAMTSGAAALAYLLPGVPVFAWLVQWARRAVRPTATGAAPAARRLLSYGTRAYGGDVASILSGQLDKVILVNLLAPAAYGVYVVAFNVSRLLTMLATAIVPVLLPKAAGRSAADVTAVTTRALSIAMPLVVAGAVGMIAIGSVLLRALYGPEFAAGYAALCVLAVEAVLATLVQLLMQPYLALNRPGVVTGIQVTSLAALVAGMWWLVPAFGIEGGAAALLVSTLVRAACCYFAYRPALRETPPRVWPTVRGSVATLRKLGAAL